MEKSARSTGTRKIPRFVKLRSQSGWPSMVDFCIGNRRTYDIIIITRFGGKGIAASAASLVSVSSSELGAGHMVVLKVELKYL